MSVLTQRTVDDELLAGHRDPSRQSGLRFGPGTSDRPFEHLDFVVRHPGMAPRPVAGDEMVGALRRRGEDPVDDDVEHLGRTVAPHRSRGDAGAQSMPGDPVVARHPRSGVDALHAVDEDHAASHAATVGSHRLPLARRHLDIGVSRHVARHERARVGCARAVARIPRVDGDSAHAWLTDPPVRSSRRCRSGRPRSAPAYARPDRRRG